MAEKTINDTMIIEQRSEGERLTDFLTSMFYDIKSKQFSLIGLYVNKQQNGSYKIEFMLDSIEQQEERSK